MRHKRNLLDIPNKTHLISSLIGRHTYTFLIRIEKTLEVFLEFRNNSWMFFMGKYGMRVGYNMIFIYPPIWLILMKFNHSLALGFFWKIYTSAHVSLSLSLPLHICVLAFCFWATFGCVQGCGSMIITEGGSENHIE